MEFPLTLIVIFVKLTVDLPIIDKRIRLIRMFNITDLISAHTAVRMQQIDVSGMTSCGDFTCEIRTDILEDPGYI